ncbi:MAG: hypothetical protein IIC57_07065, partial [Proteobacteria bacterium]|nr:hypothetical protein [Pseudomonadota bacterium]
MKGDLSPDTILVYVGSNRDDAIGENVIKLPLLRALGDAFTGARITWIAGLGPAQFDGILKPLAGGMIDEFITDLHLSDNPLAVLGIRPPLAGRRFGLIIDTQHLPARTLRLRRIPHECFVSPAWRYAFSDRKPPGGATDGGTLAESPAPQLVAPPVPATVGELVNDSAIRVPVETPSEPDGATRDGAPPELGVLLWGTITLSDGTTVPDSRVWVHQAGGE